MATPLATAFVRIRPDTSGFQQATSQGIAKAGLAQQGVKHGQEFGKNFGTSAAKWMAGTIGFFGAAAAVTTVYKAMVGVELQSTLVSNAIKATGGVANVSKKHASWIWRRRCPRTAGRARS